MKNERKKVEEIEGRETETKKERERDKGEMKHYVTVQYKLEIKRISGLPWWCSS